MNINNKSKNARVSPEFDKMMKEISKQRYLEGLDKKELKLPRITKAITRIPGVKEVLLKSEFEDE